MKNTDIEELEGSELGTKEYWDKSYNTEIGNYKSHGDVGEVWFDEDSQIRVIDWMLKNDIPTNNRIIDLGNMNDNFCVQPFMCRQLFAINSIVYLSYSEWKTR